MLTIDDKQADLFEGWIPEEFLNCPRTGVRGPGAGRPAGDGAVLEEAKMTGRPTIPMAAYVRADVFEVPVSDELRGVGKEFVTTQVPSRPNGAFSMASDETPGGT